MVTTTTPQRLGQLFHLMPFMNSSIYSKPTITLILFRESSMIPPEISSGIFLRIYPEICLWIFQWILKKPIQGNCKTTYLMFPEEFVNNGIRNYFAKCSQNLFDELTELKTFWGRLTMLLIAPPGILEHIFKEICSRNHSQYSYRSRDCVLNVYWITSSHVSEIFFSKLICFSS